MRKNEVRELIEQIRGELANYGRDEVVPMLRELEELTEVYGHLDDIIDNELINELVKSEVENGGWQRVACLLAKVDYLNDEYYVIDGYGNLRHLDKYYLENTLEDMLREIDLDEYDEEEEDIE